MRSLALAAALVAACSLTPPAARADVVPPVECGMLKHWEGGHSGSCEWGPSFRCSASPAGTPSPLAIAAASGVAAAVRRRRA
jgi:uncharacterized protein (TIGR03382 family)